MNVKTWLLIILMLLSGCAAIPPSENLGTSGKVQSPERIAEAVTMIVPGAISQVDVYKIPIPPEWQEREVACRTFESLEEKDVQICRKASRVFIDGQEKRSAFIWNGYWYVSVPKGQTFSSFVFPPAEGEQQ